MKEILSRKTMKTLTLKEAEALAEEVKIMFPYVQVTEHKSVYGYPCKDLVTTNIADAINARKNHIFAFHGAICDNEGYKAKTISFVSLPKSFEEKFPNYVVIG